MKTPTRSIHSIIQSLPPLYHSSLPCLFIAFPSFPCLLFILSSHTSAPRTFSTRDNTFLPYRSSMSFKFPSFNLQSLQESLPDFENLSKSFSQLNAGKNPDQFRESLQPFAAKTTQMISSQLQQVQHMANIHTGNAGVEVSELPAEYLQLEANCDLVLKLYTDLIHFSNDTFAKVSYDYPPANNAINKIRDAKVGSLIGEKFNQLKNVSTPQELEKVLMGGTPDDSESTVDVQTISAKVPKTLYGQLAQIAEKHSEELKSKNSAISLALLQLSSTYVEIASARLDMDSKIMDQFNQQLITILNEQFILVNELRKKVYSTRLEFDLLRSTSTATEEEEENEEIIAKEDELVSATEAAVVEMKKLLKPSKNVSLVQIFVNAQKEWFELSAKKLASLSESLANIDVKDEDD